ncbi:MAG: 30S ribosomal protein S1, partial [Pseudomonadales bacterium]|nr:30S ribosomal protein S1 [Pseudomonadales bacterium]
IPRLHFLDDDGEFKLEIGDEVNVALEAVEDGMGATRLSREKARRAEAWIELEKAQEDEEIVQGIISGKVKGGFTVDVRTIRAFLPGSLVDIRPVKDTTHLEGQVLDFKVIKLDQKRNNVVVSRRAVLEAANSVEREALLETLTDGVTIKGIVKNLTDYGAFIDLGGVDGLLHITDMTWKRIKHPSELLSVGDEIDVKVLKYDKEKTRVSLGLKQLGEDPWVSIKNRYPINSRVQAKVTNLTDYGCFAELEEGIEGLVHVSEMDWTNKNVHPSKIVQVGDEVEVMVLDIDADRRRISLGIKQCIANPWDSFGEKYQKNDKVSGTIKSITDFGIFIGLEGGIDGLIHLSDISWNEAGEDAVREFKKGDEIDTLVLSIDPERERISLGIKQLISDPFGEFVAENDKGSVVKGTVLEVDEAGLTITLAEEVTGYMKAGDISTEKVADARTAFSVGDSVEASIFMIDRKSRTIGLSIRAKDAAEEKAAVQEHKKAQAEAEAPATTIGDLIKAQMGGSED